MPCGSRSTSRVFSPPLGESGGEIDRGRRLADTTLLVRDDEDSRRHSYPRAFGRRWNRTILWSEVGHMPDTVPLPLRQESTRDPGRLSTRSDAEGVIACSRSGKQKAKVGDYISYLPSSSGSTVSSQRPQPLGLLGVGRRRPRTTTCRGPTARRRSAHRPAARAPSRRSAERRSSDRWPFALEVDRARRTCCP